MTYYNKEVEEVLSQLQTSTSGLSDQEAAARLEKYGYNSLSEEKRAGLLVKFLKQLVNPMIIVLIVAAVISGILGEWIDMSVILGVVLINAIMSTVQEGKAEKAIAKLKSMATPYTAVIRNGSVKMTPSNTLVPGDIMQISAGDVIAADARIIKSNSLMSEEAALTGESTPVEKSAEKIDSDNVIVGDQKNMLFTTGKIIYGTGLAVVTATGMNTEIGKIANILKETKEETTPLQRRMNEISGVLTIAILIMCLVILGVNLLMAYISLHRITIETFMGFFTLSVSIAVAAIPEGLPAVVTLVLALGVQKMAKRHSIVRKLNAVETLGCVQFICSDKTGTLTQNKMSVKKNYFDGKIQPVEFPKSPTADYFLKCLMLCNDSVLEGEQGDPTEIALLKLGADNGVNQNDFNHLYPRVFELPFDSERKLMTTVNQTNQGLVSFTKGAVDHVLKRCTHIQVGKDILPITQQHINDILNANKEMASTALRILAAAYKPIPKVPNEKEKGELEQNLIFLGLTGMQDPPRPEAYDSIKTCKKAGIKVVMITGDHKDTAVAIAKELNIIQNEKYAITGEELDKMSDQELKEKVNYYRVYARVSPEHKVKIVKALQANNNIVAMTGDGVNDAPALKTANIGVGMGITGSDVSKDVADMILTDDNFASIVTAVEEGRRIYANIKKSTRFLLSCNASEILLLFIASIITLTASLTGGVLKDMVILHTVQILFINVITDTFPAIALGNDNAEDDIMAMPPRRADESFFDIFLIGNILIQAVFMTALTYGSYFIGRAIGQSPETATTMAFATLSLIQLFHCLNIHKERKSIFGRNLFGNRMLIISIISLIIFTVLIISIEPIATLIKSVPLTFTEWLVVFGMSISIIPIVEVMKIISRAIWEIKVEKIY
ncbi:MAG TPA: cation-translocating P-type ATPase [Clostridiales bacterium]|nr:cation-translocating P-type ATPase [Clostridiales bacterium]